MTIYPNQLLAYVGGAALQKFGTLARRVGIPARAGEAAGVTYSRAGVAYGIDRTGLIRPAAANVPRLAWVDLDGDGAREPCVLVEPGRTNLITESEDLSTWTKVGTPVVTDDQETCGSLNLALVEDDDGAVAEYIHTSVAFTGDAVKAIAIYVKAGTATTTVLQLVDTTASQARLTVSLSWSGGVPTPSASVGTVLAIVALGNGVYRIVCATTSVTAANGHRFEVHPAGTTASATGTVYAGGAQAENGAAPTAYIPTDGGTASRTADTLTVPFHVDPAAMLTVYGRLARPPHADAGGAVDLGVWPGVFAIGGTGTERLGCYFQKTARAFVGQVRAGGTTKTTANAAIPAGAVLTVTTQYDPTQGVRIHNGSAWGAWTGISGWTVPTAWSSLSLTAGRVDDYLGGGIHALLVARGAHEPGDFAGWLP